MDIPHTMFNEEKTSLGRSYSTREKMYAIFYTRKIN